MVGIGGTGLSALARVLLARDEQVSGCDVKRNETTDALELEGARVMVGHDLAHLDECDVLLYTNVTSTTEEVQAAKRRGMNTVHRAEMLAELIDTSDSIAVAGTHGKTTVTYMLGHILTVAGRDPTVLVGDGTHSRAGRGRDLVAEADESDGTLVLHHPRRVLVTNVELDHPDHFASAEDFRDLFATFLENLRPDALAVVCADDAALRGMTTPARRVDYGFTAMDYSCDERRPFTVRRRGEPLGSIEMSGVPGRHNIQNACGAVALAVEMGIEFETVASALNAFAGAHRRLEYLGEWRGALVYTDYGHHPTEVAATLQAAREITAGRIILVFQPHRFSRFRVFRDAFAHSLRGADAVVVAEIYPAGERAEPISASTLAEMVPAAVFAPDFDSVKRALEKLVQAGDLVLLMGAGDIWDLARDLANAA